LSLGEEIKAKRKNDGLSAEALANLIGVSMDNIYKWEKGTRISNPEDYEKIKAWLSGNLETIPKKEKPGSVDYQAKFYDAYETIKAYNEFLQRMMESSFVALLDRQEGGSAIAIELLKRDALREANGNPEKAREILADILRRIGPGLSQKMKEGIGADHGK
jgi:transcriptional regulator with XRE-family HTH domain